MSRLKKATWHNLKTTTLALKLVLKRTFTCVLLAKYKVNILSVMHKLKGSSLYQSVIVFDIDNTLADTWPSLLNKAVYKDEATRLSGLPIFEGMAAVVKQANSTLSTQVIFLSHRPFLMRKTTKKWLQKHQLFQSTNILMLVPNVAYKYWLLKSLSQLKNKKVIYYDDLSYHHELGEVKFYINTIQKIKALNLTCVGYEEINLINKINSTA